jgi:small subunit ribosomal protein S2
MAIPQFTMRELLEAGVHFGHRTFRWNPKMKQYIFGSRNGVHIMDLQQTVPMLYKALNVIHNSVSNGGRVLFVGSKTQAQDIILEAAERSGQYYMNYRWLGGTLTNWKTINASIKRLKQLEEMAADSEKTAHMTKKELLMQSREYNKLNLSLGGIKNMAGLPDVVFVIDTNKEKIAIQEANRLGIPVIAILDSNSDPEGVDFPIPGNDDSVRALKLYTRLVSDTILDGISNHMAKSDARSAKTTTAKSGDAPRKATVKLSPQAAKAADAEDKKAATEKTEEKKAADTKDTKTEKKAEGATAKKDKKADAGAAVAATATSSKETKTAATAS